MIVECANCKLVVNAGDFDRCPCGSVEWEDYVSHTMYNHWEPLHSYAVNHANDWNELEAQQFYKQWEETIPNSQSCSCKANWKKLDLTPEFGSAKAFFEWAWRAHNTVNRTLEKPLVTLCECYATWWPERLIKRNG